MEQNENEILHVITVTEVIEKTGTIYAPKGISPKDALNIFYDEYDGSWKDEDMIEQKDLKVYPANE